jgi:predicted kinase
MKTITLTVGPAGSGKSTWADACCGPRLDCHNINRDDRRFNGGPKDWTKYKFTKANENRVTAECDASALIAVGCGADIIISDTNLNAKFRLKWMDFADTHGYEYIEKPFECSWDELRKRNNQREGGIAEPVLWNQYLKMNEYLDKDTHEHCDNPKAIIIDVDGTIAKMEGRGPYDYDKVKYDIPRNFVIAMIKGAIRLTGAKPVFLSGRDGICYQDTRNWISEAFSDGYVELYMRAEGDRRKDFVVKKEIFMENLNDKYDVIGAFDDRPQVLRMWRELEIPNIIDVSGDRYSEF